MKAKFFDEFQLGEEYLSEKRMITIEDIENFAELSGDKNPLHMDEEYAKNTIHGRRIAHGALVFSITTGLFNSIGMVDGTNIALIGHNYTFKKPVFPGDIIYVTGTVKNMKESRKPDRGVLTFQVNTYNQNDEAVIEGEWLYLMMRRNDM